MQLLSGADDAAGDSPCTSHVSASQVFRKRLFVQVSSWDSSRSRQLLFAGFPPLVLSV